MGGFLAESGFVADGLRAREGFIAAKVVKNERQKLGGLSFNGKGTWSRADDEAVKSARQSSYDAKGSSLQTFGALRAALTSSSVCPCVGQKLIGSTEGESTAFRELLSEISRSWAGSSGSSQGTLACAPARTPNSRPGSTTGTCSVSRATGRVHTAFPG